MKLNLRLLSVFANASSDETTDEALRSLQDQPEAAAYFDLSCSEPICSTINDSLLQYGEYAAH